MEIKKFEYAKKIFHEHAFYNSETDCETITFYRFIEMIINDEIMLNFDISETVIKKKQP